MKLTKNKVLVTGATSGIGLVMTTRWLALGNEVLAVGRNWEKLAALSAEYDNLTAYPCDLADEAALLDLAEHIKTEHPDLNILVNNAGIQYNYELGSVDSAAKRITREIDVNLRATILLTEALLPNLLSQPSAAVVNVTSGLAFAPKRSAAVYCATKAGLHAFSQALRYQLEGSNVKVFEVIPPMVATPMTEGRGSGKISAEDLVSEFMSGFRHDQEEMNIGKVKMLRAILRIWPRMGYRILKNA